MNPIVSTIVGISLIFLCTTLGSAFVFFLRKEISEKWNKIIIGFAGGIMLSASCFSLIAPVLEEKSQPVPGYFIAAIGIILGVLFLYLIDKFLPHLHVRENEEEGIKTKRVKKTTKMFLAVTIHNIPEGLSVGIAYGVALANLRNDSALGMTSLASALSLAIGIGLQNIPEGLAVALPFKSETKNTTKAFLYGMGSGAVEPVAAVIGLFLAMEVEAIMPWALSFSGGAMLYVILEEMVPEAKGDSVNHSGIFAFLFGFILMMVMDAAL